LKPGDRVLEVGGGTGYAAAVLSHLAHEVLAIERLPELAQSATERLQRLGYLNVVIAQGDGTRGWPAQAPFDAIVVSAGAPAIPKPLLDQLRIGGRLVIPVGKEQRIQRLLRLTRIGTDDYRQEDLGGVCFVPLIGEAGWCADSIRRESPSPSRT
jgi:protein-L-isoaspartate(D-aspartate) O-methyltransferase